MPRQKRSLSDTIGHLFRRFFDLEEPAPSTIWTTTSNTGEEEVVGVVKPLTTTNLKSHISSTSSHSKSIHSHTRSNSHKFTKSAPTTYTGTTAVSAIVSKANAVYIQRSPSRGVKGGERLKGEGKEGGVGKVKVKSVEIVPKPVHSNTNTTSTSTSNSNSNPKSRSTLPGQGNVTVGVGGANGVGVNGVLSLGGSPGSSAAAVLTAANTSFELTPLSGLIKQSYKDIGTLRAIQAERERSVALGIVGGKGVEVGGEGWGGEKVDFDGMEEHLRRFEEVYRQFLRYGGRHGDSQEEVHLVAILCKRSDVLSSNSNTSSKRNSKNGGSGSGTREKDCGF